MKKLLPILLILVASIGITTENDTGNTISLNTIKSKQAEPVLSETRRENFTFYDLGIETFNVSLGNQEKSVSFDSSLNGSVSAKVCLAYYLEEGDTPNMDVYLNENHTEANLLPNTTEHIFRANTTIQDNTQFELRSDIPHNGSQLLTLTIFQNSTLTLQTLEEEHTDNGGEDENANNPLAIPLPQTQLKILWALSIIVPLLFGVWAEKLSRKTKSQKKREEDIEEIEVIT